MRFGESTKGRKFPVEVLTSEEIRALMGKAQRGACGARDRALIATVYRAGLRVSEALDLYPKDVDLATGVVTVLRGKGGKSRVVAVDPETVALIEVWMGKRAEAGLNGRHPLFCTLEGERMLREQFSKRLKRLAARAGIQKRVHPHGLRHSRAVDLMKNRVPITVIKDALGHGSLLTTQVYVSHLAPREVIEAMREGKW